MQAFLDFLQANPILSTIIVAIALIMIFSKSNKVKARKLLNQQVTMYSGALEYANVNPKDFPWVDQQYYKDSDELLTQLGYQHQGDIEIISVSKIYPNMRSYLACYVGDQGKTSAAVYHVKIKGWMALLMLISGQPRNIKTVEFETAFNDGTYLTTIKSNQTIPLTPPPQLTRDQHPADTTIAQLLDYHRENIKNITEHHFQQTEQRLGYHPVHNLNDILDIQDALHAMMSKFKQERGYTDVEEFERINGKPLSKEQMDLVNQFQEMANKEK